ncbi:hypothetical protein [Clostridioides difficile]|uniref:hypothetical protein n=1 Tax=Clostridioides difficile TaxID=1496 RepID=UPI001F42615B|nr:hypothetical protein [Clostridioides difficile]MDL5066739.1 hypothetical protein [Clostridioides difficile]
MEKYATMIKEKLNEGKILCGVAVSLSDSVVSELIGISGYDFIWIEGEHGALDRKDIQQHMIAAHAGGAASLVRLVDNAPDLVKPIMDMGTDIICSPFLIQYKMHKKNRSSLYLSSKRYKRIQSSKSLLLWEYELF